MAKYLYICNSYPQYSIGTEVRFRDGIFETDDPALAKIVEDNDWYKVNIWPADPSRSLNAKEPEEAEPVAVAPEEVRSGIKRGGVRQGQRASK